VVSTVTADHDVRKALAGVMDPEIPACSIVDLGMVERVEVTGDAVEVDLLPTFVGCPAKDLIGQDAAGAVQRVAGGRQVRIRFVHRPAWTTDRITEEGKAALRGFGIAPHWDRPAGPTVVPLLTASNVACPYCGSKDTVQESSWGPTPCRAAHYCRACRNPFEGFKAK
jgi:ring-1,2-phenylacetyl-CoA epoxidase subunit PaaD